MSYQYQAKGEVALEQVAAVIREKFPHRCRGQVFDIEGVLEDTDIQVLPRRGGLENLVGAYLPTDPKFIVLSEMAANDIRKYRFKIAEEWCHLVLEFDMLDQKLPQFRPYELSKEQHDLIEKEAKYLARAILMPGKEFADIFNSVFQKQPHKTKALVLRHTALELEVTFSAFFITIAARARDLGLITQQEYFDHFSSKAVF